MKWKQLLLQHLVKLAHGQRHPQLIVVHLRRNDLPQTSTVYLCDAIVEELYPISPLFPGSGIAWVDLLPQQVWGGAIKPKPIEVSGHKDNRFIQKVMQQNGWSMLGQQGICFGLPHLFRDDEAHLSQEGCNIYLSNLSLRVKHILWDEPGEPRTQMGMGLGTDRT